MWADMPVPTWDLDAFAKLLGGQPLPGSGPPVSNDPARTARVNELDRDVIARHPAVRIIAYAEQLMDPDGTIAASKRYDGLHLTIEAVRQLADTWLFDELGRRYDEIEADPRALLVTPQPNTWGG
jgi:hypothetical protein